MGREIVFIRGTGVSDPIAKPDPEHKEWRDEVDRRPENEGVVAVIEAIPMQNGSNSHQCGKDHDRKKASFDPMPTGSGSCPHKKVGPSQVDRSEDHRSHARLDCPGEQFPRVIREQVEGTDTDK